jgi:hypothetical protein
MGRCESCDTNAALFVEEAAIDETVVDSPIAHLAPGRGL